MDNEKQLAQRTRVLLGIFSLCLLFFVVLLYDAQVVDHESYLARSTTQVTTSETVESSRGVITDRNGKVLVSNHEIYIIDFDPDLVKADEGETHDKAVSRALLRLIRLCGEYGVSWTDTMPISDGDGGFYYTLDDASSTTVSRFRSYLSKMKWSDRELSEESHIPLMTASLKE